MIFALALALTAAPELPDLRVVVGPTASAPAAVTDRLLERLRALPGITAIDLRALGAAVGTDVEGAWLDCAEDTCRTKLLEGVRWDRALVSSRATETLRAHLLDDTARVISRVSLQVSEDALLDGVDRLVEELLPERVARTGVAVEVSGLPQSARVRVDEAPTVMAPTDGKVRLRLLPGEHRLEARAPGRTPWVEAVRPRVGETLETEAQLSVRRGPWPWVLGGVGLGLVGGGVGFGLAAEGRASDWSDACAGGTCASGYTYARYLEDQNGLDSDETLAGVLVGVGAAAVVGAVVWWLLEDGGSGPEDGFELPEASP